jgi:LPS O-antigen subunit length determinant protein (WzzB/FepE family)
MTSPKKYNDQNEIDLSKFIIHLWDNKLKILIITAITIIIVFVFQNFKEPAKPKYNSETQIRPITNFDEAKYVFYNSYLKIINEKNYLDLNAINQNLIQKNLYSPSFSSSLIINKSFLIGLFIDKLNQNSTFIEPIKKFELVKKENYPNNSEYESAVIKLASMIKLVPPVKNENKIYWTIHIKDFEKNNLRDFLKFVEEKANQEIRLYLESTFKKRIESEKKLINYEIEDLNIQISQNLRYLEKASGLDKDSIKEKAYIKEMNNLEIRRNFLLANKNIQRFEEILKDTPISNPEKFYAAKIIIDSLVINNSNKETRSSLSKQLILAIIFGLLLGVIFTFLSSIIKTKKNK